MEICDEKIKLDVFAKNQHNVNVSTVILCPAICINGLCSQSITNISWSNILLLFIGRAKQHGCTPRSIPLKQNQKYPVLYLIEQAKPGSVNISTFFLYYAFRPARIFTWVGVHSLRWSLIKFIHYDEWNWFSKMDETGSFDSSWHFSSSMISCHYIIFVPFGIRSTSLLLNTML